MYFNEDRCPLHIRFCIRWGNTKCKIIRALGSAMSRATHVQFSCDNSVHTWLSRAFREIRSFARYYPELNKTHRPRNVESEDTINIRRRCVNVRSVLWSVSYSECVLSPKSPRTWIRDQKTKTMTIRLGDERYSRFTHCVCVCLCVAAHNIVATLEARTLSMVNRPSSSTLNAKYSIRLMLMSYDMKKHNVNIWCLNVVLLRISRSQPLDETVQENTILLCGEDTAASNICLQYWFARGSLVLRSFPTLSAFWNEGQNCLASNAQECVCLWFPGKLQASMP